MLSLLLKPWIATCRETRDHLSDYLDGDLGARTRVRIMRHLARCEHCRALLDSLTRTLEQLRSLGTRRSGLPGTGDGESDCRAHRARRALASGPKAAPSPTSR